MPVEEFIYNARKVVINTDAAPPQVTIDDEDIPIFRSKESGRFVATEHFGFNAFDSLVVLAKEVIDQVINHRR